MLNINDSHNAQRLLSAGQPTTNPSDDLFKSRAFVASLRSKISLQSNAHHKQSENIELISIEDTDETMATTLTTCTTETNSSNTLVELASEAKPKLSLNQVAPVTCRTAIADDTTEASTSPVVFLKLTSQKPPLQLNFAKFLLFKHTNKVGPEGNSPRPLSNGSPKLSFNPQSSPV